ncbi:uncharacterized protein A4U43_C05F20720 [Asparagus officinalis]|uniref:Cellulose synthase-like protein G3 n=2 Tax=Asparagus officinalis TaxID=4686 RepID=A0A5P1EU91_ASPOF|nr:uncharacterized protein A4U43_C05F20720 [Asparagus officinalis]
MMYEKMKENVENVMEKGYVRSDHLENNAEECDAFKKWKSYTRRDHPAVVQVLLESSKDFDIMGHSMPNLIYVSREKRPTTTHHFKAGALNALTRVSSIMSNSPVILTLDCDMSSNDPQTPRRALCYILDPEIAPKLAYVQFPQRFRGLNKNDIYGSEIKRLFRINPRGLDGLRGPNYVGSGCFFVRRSLYGPQSPGPSPFPSDLKWFLMTDANRGSMRSESVLKRAHEVAGCNYELDTKWGDKIGFRYGSLVEDYHTGYRMQCEGWISIFCDPERYAFLGDAPKNLNDALSQCKRWAVGLLEVAISKYSPLTFGIRNCSLLMGMGYAHYAFWPLWCIPLITYALLPQLALIFGVHLFPKLSDPWFYLYAYLFVTAYSQDLIEFLMDNGTIQTWWSDQRMWMIKGMTSFASGTIQFIMNQTGISAPGFTLTNKATEEGQNDRYDNGVFDLGVSSPYFVLLGAAAALNLSSCMLGVLKATSREDFFCKMFVPLFLSAFGVANCWPILEAMFLRKDGGRMPKNITVASILVAGVICMFGYFALVG